MSEVNVVLEELKNEATSLSVKFSTSIGEAKLKEKIEAYYAAQETSGATVAPLVEKNSEASTTGFKDTKVAKRKQREKDARKTRIITIIDNDQRSNNHTTTCSVNCGNEFFDLGTRHLPLGEKIEVCQGHINVLKEVFIPIHNRDPKTGLSITKSRPRYSINYEDMQ